MLPIVQEMILGDIQINSFHSDSHIYFTDTIAQNLRNILSSIKEVSRYGTNCGSDMSGTEVWGTFYQKTEKNERRIRGEDERNEDNDSFIKT